MNPMKINTKSIFKTALSFAIAVLFASQSTAQCNPPTDPVVISNLQATSFTISWGSAAIENTGGQYEWEVRLATDANPGAIDPVQQGYTINSLLTANASGLDFSTNYIVYVSYQCDQLNNSSSQSSWISTTVTTSTLATPVATPATNVNSTTLRLNWNFVPGADGYLVDLSTDATFATGNILIDQNVSPGSATFYDASGLTENTEYFYRVKAYGSNDNNTGTQYITAESNVVSRTTLGPYSDVYTWESPGIWVPFEGAVDDTKDLIINFDYDMTAINSVTGELNESFTGKSLRINDGYTLTIADGGFIDIRSEITNLNAGNDGLLVKSGGAIVQRFTGSNNNIGGMKLERKSAKIYRQDYTMWSSPTSDPLGSATAQTLLEFSPLTVPTRFYNYNTNGDLFVKIDNPDTETFEPGKGYLIRVSNYHPDYVIGQPGTSWLGTFEGPINGGFYQREIQIIGNNFNMIGNPYPSQLSLDDLMIMNTNLTGTAYFWRRKNEQNTDNGTLSAYYATWTTAGGTGIPVTTQTPTSEFPDSYVQPGQGFIVQANTGLAAPQNITFRNTMRSYDNPFAPFFKGAANNVIEKNRFWLNVSAGTQVYNQMLIAYMPNAINGLDRADGKFFGDANVALTSLLDNEEYTIQGRAPFTNADVVPLHFRTPVAESFTITFDHADGIFNTTQNIYLKDNLTNITHDIKAAPYTFATEAGTFANRFEIVYSSPLTVGDVVLDANAIAVVKQNGMIVINSGSVTMSNVKIFDIRGRLIAQKNNVNASETSINAGAENQVLIVQIVSDNGVTISKKFVN